MNRSSRILVIGGRTPAGKALIRRLQDSGHGRILTVKPAELLRQTGMERFFKKNRPEYVFFMGHISGGISANSKYPAEFIYGNLQAEINVIHCAYKAKVRRLLFMASSCAYPRNCPQPMKEEYLFTGLLEPTSEAFATAKIAGIKMCQYYNAQYGADFRCAIPATVYGPDDNFDPDTSHVIPAMITRFHAAVMGNSPSVTVWGSGRPRREFIHADDLADAVLYIMKQPKVPPVLNIGSGEEISVKSLGRLIKKVTGYNGKLKLDRSKPDGAPRKSLDTGKLGSMGWTARVCLETGLADLYNWYKNHAR